MTVKGSMVRDYTSGRHRLDVDVVFGEVYEALVALYAISDCLAKGTDYDDAGPLERISARLDEDLTGVAGIEDSWTLYLGLLGAVHEEGLGGSMADFVSYLRGLDVLDLRRMVLEGAHPKSRDPELLKRAAAGDAAAIDEVLGEHHFALERFLSKEPAESVDRLIEIIERFYEQALAPELAEIIPALERDAADKTALSKTLPPEVFVEKATNGITFEQTPGVDRIVLVASVVIRPWTLLIEHKTARLFVYSVAEEAINGDPAAPPTYLVELYKALGDERRLRLLAELWTGEADLKTLATRLDIAKSTVHHHLRSLRTAGLVRVILRDHDRVYSLRKESLPDAGPLLEDFLNRLTPKE